MRANNKSAVIRDILLKRPNTTAADIASMLGVKPHYVYNVVYKMRKRIEKLNKRRNPLELPEAEGIPPIRMYSFHKEVTNTAPEQAVEEPPLQKLLRERLSQTPESSPSANAVQVGGNHYKSKAIQPWDYIAANGLGYFEGNVVKYVTRYKEKGGLADLEKAKHYLEKLIEQERG